MKARMLVAILAALMAVTFTSYYADADEQCGTDDQDWHCGGACNSQYRISKNAATCLSGWWDNTPPVSAGAGSGSTYGAQNLCASYGDIKAHIDTIRELDTHMHLNDSGKVRGRVYGADVRDISCCIDKSDLCYKDQVEKITSGSNAGRVRVYRVENGQRMSELRGCFHAPGALRFVRAVAGLHLLRSQSLGRRVHGSVGIGGGSPRPYLRHGGYPGMQLR